MRFARPVIKQDSAGTVLHPGQRVAYNCSGNVVAGEILDVQQSHTKIVAEGGQTYPREGHISKVRNPRSILVLSQPASDLLKYP